MRDSVTTSLYPIGRPSTSGTTLNGWLVATLNAAGQLDPETPIVLAVPKPLPSGSNFTLIIGAQAESLTLMQGEAVIAVFDCRGDQQKSVLALLAGGEIGLLSVEAEFRLDDRRKLAITERAPIDMQPFYDDHQHRLAVMQAHDPQLHAQQMRIFSAMPAYARAAEQARNRSAPAPVSAEKLAQIRDDILKHKTVAPAPVTAPIDPLKAAILRGRSQTSDQG